MSGGTLDYNIWNTQAEIHKLKSEYVETRSIHTRILEGTTIQDPYSYGWALLNVAEIDLLIGPLANDVQRNCDRARKMLDTVGYTEGVVMCDIILADLYLREGNSLTAQTICESDISRWGDLDGMSSWTVVYLVNSLKRTEKLGIYKALKFLGDVFLSQEDEPTAINISMGHSGPLKAVEFWERARPMFERSSQAKQVQVIDERVANISEDVLEQHRNNLAHLAELNALAGTVEELENDLSDIEDLDNM
ncbi:hypothetical protein B0H13DRAFT_1879242 [Mycena leptocephala]|nr:hypothetical protein B0H13DRAFT_1879242 [Mycena leptocephala]